MSINELIAVIKAVQHNPNSPISYDNCTKIITTLRAGQAMRESIRTGIQSDIYIATDLWDEACKGSRKEK